MPNTSSNDYSIDFEYIANELTNHVIPDNYIRLNTEVKYSIIHKKGYINRSISRGHYTIWQDNTGIIQFIPDRANGCELPNNFSIINLLNLKIYTVDFRFLANSRFKITDDSNQPVSPQHIPETGVYASVDNQRFYAVDTVNLLQSSNLSEDIQRDALITKLYTPNRSKNIAYNKLKREAIKEIKFKGSLGAYKEIVIDESIPEPTGENIYTDETLQGLVYYLLTKPTQFYYHKAQAESKLSFSDMRNLVNKVEALVTKFRYTDEQCSQYIDIRF